MFVGPFFADSLFLVAHEAGTMIHRFLFRCKFWKVLLVIAPFLVFIALIARLAGFIALRLGCVLS